MVAVNPALPDSTRCARCKNKLPVSRGGLFCAACQADYNNETAVVKWFRALNQAARLRFLNEIQGE